MADKRIAVIGGGISGLSVLHYLNQRNTERALDLCLFEKNASSGGTIATQRKNDCIFEAGPNGFLDSNERTLQLVKEVDAERFLVRASEVHADRFISLDGWLLALPTDPKEFFRFKALSLWDKLRVSLEYFIGKGKKDPETIYKFGVRRFGRKFTELFLDPMVSGVFGGDVKKLNLRLAFPRIYDMEQLHGSLIKAMLKAQKAKQRGEEVNSVMPRGKLTSFTSGMGCLIGSLQEKYKEQIHFGKQVVSVTYADNRYKIALEDRTEYADEVYLCTPAYVTQRIVKEMWPELAKDLGKIYYAPVAVVNLVFWKELLEVIPQGFGYLVPSLEKRAVLGVLFENNIFPGRCPDDKFMFRVMIGGANHPDVVKLTEKELVQMAKREILAHFNVKGDAQDISVKLWDKGIPQYDQVYYEAIQSIERKMSLPKNLHLVANYLNGIAMNDCINNAYRAVQNSHLL